MIVVWNLMDLSMSTPMHTLVWKDQKQIPSIGDSVIWCGRIWVVEKRTWLEEDRIALDARFNGEFVEGHV